MQTFLPRHFCKAIPTAEKNGRKRQYEEHYPLGCTVQKLGAGAKYNFWETPQGNLYNFPSAAGRGSGTERDMAMKIWSIIQFSKFSRGGCSSVPSSFLRSLERGRREDFEIYAQEGEELKVFQGRGGGEGRQKSVSLLPLRFGNRQIYLKTVLFFVLARPARD